MNPAQPPAGTRIAALSDIPEAGACTFDFQHGDARFSLLLARRGEAVFGYENRCPHAGYPLERPDGRVLVQEGRYIVCTAHGASFAFETGACAGGPCNKKPLTPVAVAVRDGAVFMIPQARDRDHGGGAS